MLSTSGKHFTLGWILVDFVHSQDASWGCTFKLSCPSMGSGSPKFYLFDDWFPRKSVLNIHWNDWCWSWSSNTLATWCKELTHCERPWCWERLKAGGEGDSRGWDDWMASQTQWTWVWASFRSWWWTGNPGMLQSMGLQRVRHDSVTELTEENSKETSWLNVMW